VTPAGKSDNADASVAASTENAPLNPLTTRPPLEVVPPALGFFPPLPAVVPPLLAVAPPLLVTVPPLAMGAFPGDVPPLQLVITTNSAAAQKTLGIVRSVRRFHVRVDLLRNAFTVPETSRRTIRQYDKSRNAGGAHGLKGASR